jgi:hypothetical protein
MPPCMSESDVVIRVEGLGKTYSLHHEPGERYTGLRDVVARQAKAAGRLLNPFTLAGPSCARPSARRRRSTLRAGGDHRPQLLEVGKGRPSHRCSAPARTTS